MSKISLSAVAVLMIVSCGQQNQNEATAVEAQEDAVASTAAQLSPDAAQHQQACQDSLKALEQKFTALESLAAPYTVASVLGPINDFSVQLADVSMEVGLLESVHPDASIREVSQSCASSLADMSARFGLSRPVYEALSQVKVSEAAADTQRYHQQLMEAFKLSGVDKDEATRARIRALNDEIMRIGQSFDRNILDSVLTVSARPEELLGLPDDYIAAHPVVDGQVSITTRYPDYGPVMTYAKSDGLRRRLRAAFYQRAYPANEAVLKDLLSKRHELALLLGKPHFAELATQDKMIGSAANVEAFIEQVATLIRPVAETEAAALLERLQEIDPEAKAVQSWQVGYLSNLLKKEQYEVDSAEVRTYFSYGNVRDGIFDLVSELFDVEFRNWDTETWHPSVESYELLQAGEVIARFHLDMHPREGKYQHAAAFGNQMGIAGRQLPISTLVCNFPGENKPEELMEFSQVTTFLHEFGHLIHALFAGQQRWAGISGISTEWDFVEAPSQMLEEWAYDYDTLSTFAKNAEGEVIPEALVAKMNRSRKFGQAIGKEFQMFYSAMSLDYHSGDPADLDLLASLQALEAKYALIPHQPETYFFANLGHLNGYSAILYTYVWSEVIAADMFSEFQKAGLRNKEVAARYRDRVLAPGGLKPAAELVSDFLGRPYSFEPFAQQLSGAPGEAEGVH